MDTIVITLVIVAWLTIVVMVSWCGAVGWRRIMQDDAPLPFFSMLRRQGLAPEDLKETSRLAIAVRHCAMCGDKNPCGMCLVSGEREGRPFCTNARFFDVAKRARSQLT